MFLTNLKEFRTFSSHKLLKIEMSIGLSSWGVTGADLLEGTGRGTGRPS